MSKVSKRKAVGNIDRLLRPQSVAIIGASEKVGSLGASVLANLERLNFQGEIHLINPKREEISGRPCLKSPEDLPLGVDAAVLAIPRVAVLDAVKVLAERKCGSAVIFSAGFAESGEEGLAQQEEIRKIASDAGMIVEGPNCLGCVNYIDQTALTFVESPIPALGDRKGVAIVSQSGAMAAVLGSNLLARDTPLTYSISTGNEAASGVEDYVEYMISDAHTSVIGMIVEQFRDPQRFLELAEKCRRAGKPIVLLHPGKSEAAAESAATHTGALAGDYNVMKTKVERAGVIVANSLEELGDIVEIAATSRALPSGGCAVLTESGAFKALTLDLAEEVELELPVLTDENAPNLRAAMPDFVAVSNPVDLTAQSLVDPDMYKRTIEALVADDRFGTVILTIIQTDDSTTEKKFPAIINALSGLNVKKSIIVAGIDEGGIVKQEYISGVRATTTPYFPSPDRAIRAISALTKYSARQFDKLKSSDVRLKNLPSDCVIPEYKAKEILGPIGIPFPQSKLARTVEEAMEVAKSLGYPVVLKAQSADLSHKSDAGGVAVGITTERNLIRAWDKMQSDIKRYNSDLELDGILVEVMGKRGIELIVGAKNDPDWGAITLVGFGGVMAELYKDVRLLPPDLTKEGIINELNQLKAAKLFHGFRGSDPVDLEAVADIILNVGQLMMNTKTIAEIDLNPVVVFPKGKGAVALDALMLVKS